ncbi:hypothetical protein DFA_10946 [Cavenderia fasciculata]|uniref:Uncharacterized protein n=1 Tax=Cavenderia fasciculata TaxID=261658 RepID=F4QBV0_CACFS|nr:uncharacterized protein DFA_10946 [Cavenderia fasciculata]EGG14688.1 hypothetical protein DFA_10946 [Cavenderia fasciculata]|eukprot:XP_004351196.1 hypothetical protein DFA_10946 [Cavenderia fasciculata]
MVAITFMSMVSGPTIIEAKEDETFEQVVQRLQAALPKQYTIDQFDCSLPNPVWAKIALTATVGSIGLPESGELRYIIRC